MRFSMNTQNRLCYLITVLALSSYVLCFQPTHTFTNVDFDSIWAGEPFNVTWTAPRWSDVAITLGNATDFRYYEKLMWITYGPSNSPWVIWNVPPDIPDIKYSLAIEVNYTAISWSQTFYIKGAKKVSAFIGLSPSSLTTTSTSSNSALSSSSSTSQPSQSSTSSSTQPSLIPTWESRGQTSFGTKAGIGVGSSLGCVAIVGLIFVAFKYGKKSSSANASEDETIVDVEGTAELDGGERGDGMIAKVELGDTGLVEAEGSNTVLLSEDERRKGGIEEKVEPVEME